MPGKLMNLMTQIQYLYGKFHLVRGTDTNEIIIAKIFVPPPFRPQKFSGPFFLPWKLWVNLIPHFKLISGKPFGRNFNCPGKSFYSFFKCQGKVMPSLATRVKTCPDPFLHLTGPPNTRLWHCEPRHGAKNLDPNHFDYLQDRTVRYFSNEIHNPR